MNKPPLRPQPPYSYSPRPAVALRRLKRRRRWTRLIVAVILLAIIGVVVYRFIPNTKAAVKNVKTAVSPTPPPSSTPAPAPAPVTNPNIPAMAATINGIISAHSDIDMSVSLIDLSNQQAEHYGDTAAFAAASTTKVIAAVDFLHQVEAGQESLSETINGNSAEYELQQMIVVSDDNAWDALRSELGYSKLQAYGRSIGATSFQAVANNVTSDDMAQVMAKLYEGQLLNASNTQLLLGYLKQANYRTYIVPAVPDGDTIYHKIGLYIDNVHDEAIITNGNKAFVIVIFTNGNGEYDWPERAQIMQQITQAALTAYF